MLTGSPRVDSDYGPWGRQRVEGCGPFQNSDFQESQTTVTDLMLKLGEKRESGVLLDLLWLLAVNVWMESMFLRVLQMLGTTVLSLSDGWDNWCSIDGICCVNKHISGGFGLTRQCLLVLQKKARSAASRDITKWLLTSLPHQPPLLTSWPGRVPCVAGASIRSWALRGSRRALLHLVPESSSAGEAGEPLVKPPCRAYGSVWGSAGVWLFLFPT